MRERPVLTRQPKEIATSSGIWRGRVERENADACEDCSLEAEMSRSRDMGAMVRFGAPDPVQVRHRPRDREALLQMPESARILRVLHEKLALGF
ncbi:MAG TPA: hypothetical protein VIN06_19640 [Devosia sp.]